MICLPHLYSVYVTFLLFFRPSQTHVMSGRRASPGGASIGRLQQLSVQSRADFTVLALWTALARRIVWTVAVKEGSSYSRLSPCNRVMHPERTRSPWSIIQARPRLPKETELTTAGTESKMFYSKSLHCLRADSIDCRRTRYCFALTRPPIDSLIQGSNLASLAEETLRDNLDDMVVISTLSHPLISPTRPIVLTEVRRGKRLEMTAGRFISSPIGSILASRKKCTGKNSRPHSFCLYGIACFVHISQSEFPVRFLPFPCCFHVLDIKAGAQQARDVPVDYLFRASHVVFWCFARRRLVERMRPIGASVDWIVC